MKGVSPLVGAVMVVVIVLAIATVVSPWVLNLAGNATTQAGQTSTTQFICQNTAYDFDTNFATSGLNWSLGGANETLEAMIINTGHTNLYNFSFEIEILGAAGREIKYLDINTSYQKTTANPLKPGQTSLLKAQILVPINATLKSVKVLNVVCPSVYPKQDV